MRFLILPILSVNSLQYWHGVDIYMNGEFAVPAFKLHGLDIPSEEETKETSKSLLSMYVGDPHAESKGKISVDSIEEEEVGHERKKVSCLYQGRVFGHTVVYEKNNYLLLGHPNILSLEGPMNKELICSKLAYLWNGVSMQALPSIDPPTSTISKFSKQFYYDNEPALKLFYTNSVPQHTFHNLEGF